MDVLAESDGKVYRAITINSSSDFTSPFSETLFPCLIWDHDGHFSDEDRSTVALALINAGCRYAVCGGENCEAWHDAVDREDVKRHIDDSEEIRDAELVMTTWHDGESPDDVAFFFVLNTNFADHEFQRYFALHVGTSAARDLVDAAVRKYAHPQKAG
jgi:hypothetical protein